MEIEPVQPDRHKSQLGPQGQTPQRGEDQLRIPLMEETQRITAVRRISKKTIETTQKTDRDEFRRGDVTSRTDKSYSRRSIIDKAQINQPRTPTISRPKLNREISSEDIQSTQPKISSLDQLLIQHAKRSWPGVQKPSPIHGQIKMSLQAIPHADPNAKLAAGSNENQPAPLSPRAADHPRAHRYTPGRDPYRPRRPQR